MPKRESSIVTVPSMNYIAVRGHGNPNAEDGDYQKAIKWSEFGSGVAAFGADLIGITDVRNNCTF